MSRRKRPVVLVYGESLNEARAVKALILALCPALDGQVHARPKPTSLVKDATPDKIRTWMELLARMVKADAKGGEVACVFVHRDADGPDPKSKLAVATEKAMSHAGLDGAHAAVPVRTIEAWWLMFPEALAAVVETWGTNLGNVQRDVDRVPDPVKTLQRATGKGKQQKRRYEKADSPQVAENVRRLGLVQGQRGRSASFDRFAAQVETCCARINAA